MTIVIDTNLLVAPSLPLPYGELAARRILSWRIEEQRLIAPVLMEYELTTLLRKAVFHGWMDTITAANTLRDLLLAGPELIGPDVGLDQDALHWAQRVGQSKAYDSQYLALAAREGAPLWTADRRLAQAARGAGLDWVNWIGDWKAEV